MRSLVYVLAGLSLLMSGAIFGFFYAWVCSTMWGLDAADPAVAIEAMKAMNSSVRNMVFAPAFFGTSPLLLITALLAFLLGLRGPAAAFALAAVVYLIGGQVLTMSINVPMNEALAATATPADADGARRVWREYSQPWQYWNIVRTLASGVCLLLAGLGVALLGHQGSRHGRFG
ncbi:anthrone oxygenase family protein [Neorhizobium sp. IRAMC:178]|uniref:anthrone oxygenase family protein n=1 Tax=Neorhizobium tunisiense TaxID=3144793 RepID=UPI0031F6C475